MAGDLYKDVGDFEFVGINTENYIDETFASQSYLKDVAGRFMKNKGAIVGLICIAVIVVMAIIGPSLTPYKYYQQDAKSANFAPRIQGIESLGIFDGSETMRTSSKSKTVNKYVNDKKETGYEDTYYWFGSDTLGRDIFTRTWFGTRISLYIALLAVAIDVLFGLSYGLISGYFGGKTDMIMQRIVEIISGIPSLVVVTLLMLVLKPGFLTISIALMVNGWIGMSRIARAQMLKIKEQEYVLASKTLGAKDAFVIFREVLPNVMAQIIITSMFSIPRAIFTEAFLSFVGLGVPAPMASLGSLISDAFKSLTAHPYMILPPIIVLGVLMLSFNLLADGLRDAFEPKMKEM